MDIILLSVCLDKRVHFNQRFLDFIGVTEESERSVHNYYLQFFQPGQKVVDYLQELPDNSLDAIFSAHLVEHLEVEAVYGLIQEAYRILKPGGFLLLTTPNVHAFVAHFDLFWLHFDHKRFYHPRLLEFVMRECKFNEIIYGDNTYNQKYYHTSRLLYFFIKLWWRFKLWLGQLIIPPQFIGRSFEVYVIGYKYPTDISPASHG